MPQINAWECSHTELVFKRKSDYIKHLRHLGARRFVMRNMQRSLDALKQTATSPDDICAWLEQHGRALMKMENTLQELAREPSERIVEGEDLHNRATVDSAKNGPFQPCIKRNRLLEIHVDTTIPKKYLSLLMGAINRLDGVQHNSYGELNGPPSLFRITLHLEVEQWQWTVPYKLYDMAKQHQKNELNAFDNIENGQYIEEFLGAFYPQMPMEILIWHFPVISRLDGVASFIRWLEQYGPDFSPEKPIELPGVLVEMALG
jgi:hypothetical protein